MSSGKTVGMVNAAVTGVPTPQGTSTDSESTDGMMSADLDTDPTVPYNQAVALATQSIAQSTALAVSDSADMLRNIETVMTTAMGVAMAKWLADPANVLYGEIITAANTAITNAAANYKTIGTNAQDVLALFEPKSS